MKEIFCDMGYLGKFIERKQQTTDILRKSLRSESQRLVDILRKRGFEFERVYLFGSTIKDKSLSIWSDIDLAIEGLSAEMFYKVYACLLKHSNFPVDLKPFEALESRFVEKIEKEGEIIYDKKKDLLGRDCI